MGLKAILSATTTIVPNACRSAAWQATTASNTVPLARVSPTVRGCRVCEHERVTSTARTLIVVGCNQMNAGTKLKCARGSWAGTVTETEFCRAHANMWEVRNTGTAERAQGVWVKMSILCKTVAFSLQNSHAADHADTFQRLAASVECWSRPQTARFCTKTLARVANCEIAVQKAA